VAIAQFVDERDFAVVLDQRSQELGVSRAGARLGR
jgi:hypothetical protein